MSQELAITYIGGPTALLEFAGLRFLTDPTFDPAGSEYKSGPATLRKLTGPALQREMLGRVDIVLLSHDHHSDNLDSAGREFLGQADRVLTTVEGAARLGSNAVGLANWQKFELPSSLGGKVTITGTPCRHGPAGMDRGPVTGFVLSWSEAPHKKIYISGDSVWYEGIAEVASRFKIHIAILFMGAALVPEVAPLPLTMTAADGVTAARAFPDAKIVPLHYEGWKHFSESREVVARTIRDAGMETRLRWPTAGTRSLIK